MLIGSCYIEKRTKKNFAKNFEIFEFTIKHSNNLFWKLVYLVFRKISVENLIWPQKFFRSFSLVLKGKIKCYFYISWKFFFEE